MVALQVRRVAERSGETVDAPGMMHCWSCRGSEACVRSAFSSCRTSWAS